MHSLTRPRIIYILIIAITLVYALLSETDIIPTQYLSLDTQGLYALQMLCVALSIGGTWISLRLFAFNKMKRMIQNDASGNCLAKCNVIRTLIIGTALLVNTLAYYATMSTSALYCMLICAVGILFCWPKPDEV